MVAAMRHAERATPSDRTPDLAQAENNLAEYERAWAAASERLLATIARPSRWWRWSDGREQAEEIRRIRAEIAEAHRHVVVWNRKVDGYRSQHDDQTAWATQREITIREGKAAQAEQARRARTKTASPRRPPTRKVANPPAADTRRPH